MVAVKVEGWGQGQSQSQSEYRVSFRRHGRGQIEVYRSRSEYRVRVRLRGLGQSESQNTSCLSSSLNFSLVTGSSGKSTPLSPKRKKPSAHETSDSSHSRVHYSFTLVSFSFSPSSVINRVMMATHVYRREYCLSRVYTQTHGPQPIMR